MLRGEKVLITGPAGGIAEPLCSYLATDNDVWGIARFSEVGSRERVEALGVTTRVCDLSDDRLGDLPDDFTYVLHLAALIRGSDYDAALSANAEGTGLLMQHCRKAKAVLVMSTGSVYRPHPDPRHPYLETDPLGEDALPGLPTYSISKIAQEGVARAAARMLGVPVVIARMNAAYGNRAGLQAIHLDQILRGETIVVRSDPCLYSPIAQADIHDQLQAILGMASVPATIVNWGGDVPLGPHDWVPFLAELVGRDYQLVVEPVSGAKVGVVVDSTKRMAVTGPCKVGWRDGMRRMAEMLHPELF